MKKKSITVMLKKIKEKPLPKHIAIIMDGNGRWAKQHNLPRIRGHLEGSKRIKEIINTANRVGIKYLTLYAFSTENWQRPKREVNYLMTTLYRYLKKEGRNLLKNNIKLLAIGQIERLPKRVKEKLNQIIYKTKDNSSLVLCLALSYGGREEIIMAINSLKKSGKSINEEKFSEYLYTKNIPDPDLLIRTSGEIRISNFLLWQIAYSEFYFTKVLWPDFRERNFLEAILEYQSRQRRFGKVI